MLITKAKRFIRDLLNDFSRSESSKESKDKWNALADENSRYFIMSDFGKNIDENKFRQTGQKDFLDLIKNDPLLREKLHDFSQKSVLEIGCGTGRISEFLSGEFRYVAAIDISEKMIETAKERLRDKTNINFVATDGKNYPLERETVDFVFSFIVFQHMADRETIRNNFEESARVLKTGGIMKVQLRGLPTEKRHWFYGPSFNSNQVKKIIKNLPLSIVKMEGEHQKYFWLWLEKK